MHYQPLQQSLTVIKFSTVTNPSVSHSRFSIVLSCLEELEEPLLAAVELLTFVM